MVDTHDPLRQANYLRESLAQDKRPLGFFLGAGCPTAIRVQVDGSDEPLIPDIDGLTQRVYRDLKCSSQRESFEKVCAHLKADGNEDPTIEDWLTHIRSMCQVAGSEAVRGLTAKELDSLDEAICEKIVELSQKALPTVGTPYHKLAAWIQATARTEPVEIFTPNYDTLLEQALEDNRVPYFDGFVGSRHPFFDVYAMEEDRLPPRWARLWKLHGSINWCQEKGGPICRGEFSGKRRVIHPSHLKYDESRRMPYLAMIDRQRAFLKKPFAVLVTCGYSFRDNHLNEVLIQGLQGNPTAIIFGLLYKNLVLYPKAVNLSTNQANLNLLGPDDAIIGARQAPWLGREASDKTEPSVAVEWETKPDMPDVGTQYAIFKLGDFLLFGSFLAEMIGSFGVKSNDQ
jgi:SIR2-like domain